MRLLNPLFLVAGPARHLAQAVLLPVQALFVVGLCALVNAMTSPGHWWFQWVAFGMGIAVLVAWMRALKLLILMGLVYAGVRTLGR